MKLRQIVGGGVYTDVGAEELHSVKLDALADLVEEASGQPLLVAVGFKHEAERIRAMLKDTFKIDAPYLGGGISPKASDEIADRWNAGKLPVLLAHPTSVAHGLNLQAGGHTVCWFTLTWNLEEYDQFNRRVYRQGQKNAVIIHHLIARDTIDGDVLEALQGKDRTQKGLLNALKKRATRKELTNAV
jgi:SNF2 family DNA or RNA helicase